MTLDYSKWPVITCPEDLPEDGSLDRMFAEWLVATGVIDREDFDLQIRLTAGNRSARLSVLEDWEAERVKYNEESKIFTDVYSGISWLHRTVPLKRGRHRKD